MKLQIREKLFLEELPEEILFNIVVLKNSSVIIITMSTRAINDTVGNN